MSARAVENIVVDHNALYADGVALYDLACRIGRAGQDRRRKVRIPPNMHVVDRGIYATFKGLDSTVPSVALGQHDTRTQPMRIEEREPTGARHAWPTGQSAVRAPAIMGRMWHEPCELCGRCRGKRPAAAVHAVEHATAYQPE